MKYVVVGGGIAAVCCCEELAILENQASIIMITASHIVKSVSNVKEIGRAIEEFEIEEVSGETVFRRYPNVKIVYDFCQMISPITKEVKLKSGISINYDKLCLAMGGKPKLISKNKLVIGIRDTESVKAFQKRLANARRIIIVGNGGIASELIYELKNIEIIWAIKHKNILATFVDAGAAEFLISHINESPSTSANNANKPIVVKRLKYTHASGPSNQANYDSTKGSALGPDWVSEIQASGAANVPKNVHVEYECEVDQILDPEDLEKDITVTKLPELFDSSIIDWPVYTKLTNGEIFGCDFIVSATGVEPNVDIELPEKFTFTLANDNGILVDDQMETNIPEIYAAGDLCSAGWQWHPHWIQMRLWTQAKQMGTYAARCMVYNAKTPPQKMELDLCFEIFTHVTKFFGFKVVLLGLFNSQRLGPDHEVHVRVRKGTFEEKEYAKIVINDGKVQGAILIGETDLEETLENLILDQTDVSDLDLLNPTVDIEDYFD